MAMTLVTGGQGFVGKRLVHFLRAQGDSVCAFDLLTPSHEDDIQGSITDASAVQKAMRGAETVYHLAANAQLWSRDMSDFERVNIAGTELVCKSALDAGVKTFVHCSSLTTLVSVSTPVGKSFADEDTVINEHDAFPGYPRSKWHADRIVSDFVQQGLNAIIAIATEPVGSGDEGLTPPTRMMLDFAAGRTPAYIDCVLNLVPVDDLAKGLIAVGSHGKPGEKYLLAGENITMRALLELLEDATGRAMPKTRLPYWVALMAGLIDTHLVAGLSGKPPKAPLTGVRLAGRQVHFSGARAEHELGWQAGPAAPAVLETINWLKERGDLA